MYRLQPEGKLVDLNRPRSDKENRINRQEQQNSYCQYAQALTKHSVKHQVEKDNIEWRHYQKEYNGVKDKA